jgi:hypothetical protein
MKRETASRARRPWGFVPAIAAILASACAHARPLVEHPSSTLCAHVDPAQKRLVVVGRWRDQDVRVAIDTVGTDGSVSKGRAASLVARPGKRVRYAGASGLPISSPKKRDDGVGDTRSRGGVLPRDEAVAHHHLRLPQSRTLVARPKLHEGALEIVRNLSVVPGRFLLGVAERGDGVTCDEMTTVGSARG